MNFREKIYALPGELCCREDIRIVPIKDDWDLWFAVVECRLKPGQQEYVNPAGFSIGRAWLNPENNVPCIIWNGEERIGYICLRHWTRENPSTDWSYYLDAGQQGKGYGRTAAGIAVGMLKAAMPNLPIKLSVEAGNEKSHRLYRSLGFLHSGELDGNDLVFELR